MAKTMKKLLYVRLEPDDKGLIYGKCRVAYEVGSSDDANLVKTVYQEYTLSGQDLTDAINIFNKCKSQAESDEGIS